MPMAASNLRKRRGVVRASVTRLNERIFELEGTTDVHHITDPAHQLLTKLQTLDSDFKKAHFDLIDLIDEADTTSLENEQAVINKFDDDVSDYTVRLEALIKRAPLATPVVPPPDRRPLTRRCLVFGLAWSKLMM